MNTEISTAESYPPTTGPSGAGWPFCGDCSASVVDQLVAKTAGTLREG